MPPTTLTLSEQWTMNEQVEAAQGELSPIERAAIVAGWIAERNEHRARKAAGLPRTEPIEELPWPVHNTPRRAVAA
jgi:hypothetical protein